MALSVCVEKRTPSHLIYLPCGASGFDPAGNALSMPDLGSTSKCINN
ncbi:hypothetical protein PSCLAVI8L_60086 [Pseudoclavibacter sp. 8L]|nr:hypothetical protein PSCLAVI8L_60086 [Pseudoclavibacter sp. 8L]